MASLTLTKEEAMRKSYQSTAAQAAFIASLAAKTTPAAFEAAYAEAARLNGNRPYDAGSGETITQAARRLSKTAASALIDALK